MAQEVFYATQNSKTFVESSSVVFNQIERTEGEGGWSIGVANGTTSTVGMNNMLIEGNTNVKVRGHLLYSRLSTLLRGSQDSWCNIDGAVLRVFKYR
jgi:hypothetical protein